MSAAKRPKRDTVENLYRSCKITGNCPPDVINKVENKTWADTLLQIFSSIIFLGNLGIGTGKGSSTLTVRPVPGGQAIPETIAPIPKPSLPKVTRPHISKPSRPFSVPLDTIGAGIRPVGPRPVDPSGVYPIDVVDPLSPSIVTLGETSPDNVITLGEGAIPNLDITTETGTIGGHPTIIQSANNGVAILNVTPTDPPPTRITFTHTTVNPLFPIESTLGHIDPTYDIIVNPFATTESITFGEEIPLEPITPRFEFEIEAEPTTSTPTDILQRSITRFRQLYNRNTQQVETRNVNFLGDVSRAIQFGFENPAFEPEVTLQFQQDLSDVAAAPDPDFANIQRISRPFYDSTPQGTIRISRLGSKAGVRTRSGIVVGQDVHYYYDISPIQSVELQTFSDSTTVEPTTETTTSFTESPDITVFPDSILLDELPETFQNAHLILNNTENNEEINIISLPTTVPIRPLIVDIGDGYFVSSDTVNRPNSVIHPVRPLEPLIPNSYVVYSNDYTLHPSLLIKRKRKRLDSF